MIGSDYSGIVCSDRWWAYDHLDPDSRQACWEHLKRDFRRHSEGLTEQQTFGEAGLALTDRLFEAWRAFDAHHNRRRLQRELKPIQTDLRRLLERAARKSQRTRLHRRFAHNLLKIWPALWTFVEAEGVEPTNNAAERSLRGPVIHRKLSHGTRSHDGERWSSAPSPPRSPAACRAARCSPTWPTCSPATAAVSRSPRLPEQGD